MRKRLWLGVLILAVAFGIWVTGNHLGCFEHHVPCSFHGDSRGLKQTVIVPALDTPMPSGKNVIWCSSFQLAWNHARDDVIHAPIRLKGATAVADRLNRGKQSETDLPPGACYATAGTVEKGIIATIQHEMAQHFPAHHEPAFESRSPDDIIAYGYLEVKAPFVTPFDTLHSPLLFTDSANRSVRLNSFGVDKGTKKEIRESVNERYYLYHGREFIVTLHTKANMQIILARIEPKATLAATVADVEAKLAEPIKYNREDERQLGENDTLVVPNMKWQVNHHFSELESQSVANPGFTGYYFTDARQSIDFFLNNTGARLKAEASDRLSCSMPHELLFNHPFLLYLRQEKAGKTAQPFFAMWVDNAELLDKW